jgi:hypothetical protein
VGKLKYGYIYLIFGLLGLTAGFLYWNFWGCTDSCPIDSNWKLSMAGGGIIGLCIAAFFHPSKQKAASSNPEVK